MKENSTLIKILHWSEVTLKVLAKSELVEFFQIGVISPSFFAYNLVLDEGGGRISPPITIFYWPEATLKV